MKLDLTLMAILKLRYSMTSSFAFQRGQTANCRNYVSHADVFRRVLYSGANPGIFDGGGGRGGGIQNLIQKGLLNFFVANYFSPAP